MILLIFSIFADYDISMSCRDFLNRIEDPFRKNFLNDIYNSKSKSGKDAQKCMMLLDGMGLSITDLEEAVVLINEADRLGEIGTNCKPETKTAFSKLKAVEDKLMKPFEDFSAEITKFVENSDGDFLGVIGSVFTSFETLLGGTGNLTISKNTLTGIIDIVKNVIKPVNESDAAYLQICYKKIDFIFSNIKSIEVKKQDDGKIALDFKNEIFEFDTIDLNKEGDKSNNTFNIPQNTKITITKKKDEKLLTIDGDGWSIKFTPPKYLLVSSAKLLEISFTPACPNDFYIKLNITKGCNSELQG